MRWGSSPHEGYEARPLRDGRMVGEWSAETDRESTGVLAVLCSCGWRGDRLYREVAPAGIEATSRNALLELRGALGAARLTNYRHRR